MRVRVLHLPQKRIAMKTPILKGALILSRFIPAWPQDPSTILCAVSMVQFMNREGYLAGKFKLHRWPEDPNAPKVPWKPWCINDLVEDYKAAESKEFFDATFNPKFD